MSSLTFDRLSETNLARCEAPDGFNHPIGSWSMSDWMVAAGGELGEAMNKVKKLNRVRDGITGNTETAAELTEGLGKEMADTIIYLDLLATQLGFNLGDLVQAKFNETSRKIGAPHRL